MLRNAHLLLVLAAFAPAFAAPGVPNFQQVNDAVYRGGQPAPDGFQYLAKLGVKTVIDLRDVGEHSQAEEETLVKEQGMRYVSIPMHGLSAPTNEQVLQALALMDDHLAGPVFVHCRRGADRTGTVIACYRIAHDHWQNLKALGEAKLYGMSFIERAMQHFVLQYAPAHVINASSSAPATATAPAAMQ